MRFQLPTSIGEFARFLNHQSTVAPLIHSFHSVAASDFPKKNAQFLELPSFEPKHQVIGDFGWKTSGSSLGNAGIPRRQKKAVPYYKVGPYWLTIEL